MEVTAEQRPVLLRQALYRFYAGLLLYPETERFETLRGGGAWIEQALGDMAQAEGPWTGDEVRRTIAWVKGFEGDLEEIQSEWVRLFGVSREDYCFPHEGAYFDPNAVGPLLAALQKEYAHAGLNLAADELPDHVSVELEYMSYLCGLEIETLRSGEDERRQRIVKAQYLFLEHHLCKWLPALVERVTHCDGGPFVAVCRAVEQMAAAERDALARAA